MYILFVTLHNIWYGKDVWYSSSAGKILLFVILLWVIITAVSSICLIASKRFCFFWANIEGALCGEMIVVDRCGGCMFYVVVTGCIFANAILSFVFVIVVDTLIFVLC